MPQDIASRLAHGRTAVDIIAEYVWASALLGYRHADLTGHPDDVHGWYDTEEGLDLRALGADRSALVSAASTAEQAARWQSDQLRALPNAWRGTGSAVALDLLTRHHATAERVTATLHAAADTLAVLGDQLSAAVDRKVEAAIEIEGRCAAQRGAWLAAARTVRTGAGDRDTASELVDQQIRPFVADAIAGDWLTAMRESTSAVADAYSDAVAALRADPVPVFSVPAGFGLGPAPAGAARVAGAPAVVTAAPYVSTSAAPAVPTDSVGLPAAPAAAQPIPLGSAPTVPAAAPTLPAAAPTDIAGGSPAAPAPASVPALGAGLPDLSSGLSGAGLPGAGLGGLSGLGQSLADMFGGLIGSSGDASPVDLDDPVDHEAEPDELEPDDVEAEEETESEGEPVDEDDDDEEDEPTDEAGDDQAVEPTEATADDAVPQPAATPVVAPPVDPVAPPVAQPQAAVAAPERTPCEIAADELPQVGS